MAIIKRNKSYWIDIGFNHQRIRKRSPENSYKGAMAFEALIRQKLARGEALSEPKPHDKKLFCEIALQWLEVYVKNNNKYSEFLSRQYILKGRIIPFFKSKYIDEISSYNIEQYKQYLLSKQGLSPKTTNNYLCILGRCLKSAAEWGMLQTVPQIKLVKVPPQKYDYLTEAEAELLLNSAEGMWQNMILLAVRTGLRFGELIALKWEDIKFSDGILTVTRNIVRNIEGSPKNNKSRIIPLTQSVLQMLSGIDKKYEYIFHDKNGRPLKHDFCRDNLHAICKKAGLRTIGWHGLRHSFASHLASGHNSIVAIKELMGHSDIKTTMRYAHVNLPVLKNVIQSLEPAIMLNGTLTAQLPIRDLESGFRSTPNLQNS